MVHGAIGSIVGNNSPVAVKLRHGWVIPKGKHNDAAGENNTKRAGMTMCGRHIVGNANDDMQDRWGSVYGFGSFGHGGMGQGEWKMGM